MAGNALTNLIFRLSLVDNLSGGVNNAQGNLNRLTSATDRFRGGMTKIGMGVGGIMAAGMALGNILEPVKRMNAALGEVQSLGVSQKTLNDLSDTALKFSSTYGASAVDFVRSSYDIQSAISGLTGNELPAFTNAAAILAMGTKASVGEVTSYFGTMYGVFQKDAEKMGKAAWVEQLAGKTAYAVKMFKTTGSEMSSAFTALGAEAQSAGIPLNEQMAILGKLQATMSGSEAGTKYVSFLNGIGKAQDELGLKFTDSHGKMLPMVDILGKIKGKFGDIDTVAKADLLKKAFGRKEAVALVKLLSTDIDGLSKSIKDVGEQTGMAQAVEMAKAISDPWDKITFGIESMKIALGNTIVPALMPFLDKINEVILTIVDWSKKFPHLARALGMATLAVISITAAMGLLSVAAGLGSIVAAGFSFAWAGIVAILTPLAPLLTAVRMAWMVFQMQLAAGAGVFAAIKAGLLAFTTQLWINVSAVWAWTVALLANPITWIVIGIVALIAALAACVIYWDDITAAMRSAIASVSGWLESVGVFDMVQTAISAIASALSVMGGLWAWIVNSVSSFTAAMVNGVASWLASVGVFGMVQAALSGVNAVIASVVALWNSWIAAIGGVGAAIVSTAASWMQSIGIFAFIDTILAAWNGLKQWWAGFKSWLAGLNPFAPLLASIQTVISAVGSIASTIASISGISMPSFGGGSVSTGAGAGKGGIGAKISNSASNKKTTVNVHNYGQKMNGATLAHEMKMAGG